MFGFLNINKPKEITSFDVISKLRKITKIKQIGHAGTLDPFATGVLPVCIGKSTRLIEYLNHDKSYIAKIQFGKTTDTYDIDGVVTKIFDKKITIEELLQILPKFLGEISQIPPIYSAIKINGKKLYEYARKNEQVKIEPRKVVITELKLLDFNEELQQATLEVSCGGGTYIRSLAYDIGKNLNSGAFLLELKRIKSGQFTIDNSVNLEELQNSDLVKKHLINPIDILNLEKYELNEEEREKVSHGLKIQPKYSISSHIVILIYSGNIYAVGQVEHGIIKIQKVFEGV